MESPPSSSIWSEAFILSDDSGLLLTSSSISSTSTSAESRSGQLPLEVVVNSYFVILRSFCDVSDVISLGLS